MVQSEGLPLILKIVMRLRGLVIPLTILIFSGLGISTLPEKKVLALGVLLILGGLFLLSLVRLFIIFRRCDTLTTGTLGASVLPFRPYTD